MQEQKEETPEEIIEGLQKQRSNKFKFLIIILSITGIIIFLALLISAYLYFKSPEKTLGIGANIESVLLSEDGKYAFIKLKGGSFVNITKIKFIFNDLNENKYNYETSDGVQEIEVPYSRSFWDWLFGRQFFGSYDYEIDSESAGLSDFNNINEIDVLFEYKTGTGEVIETPVLDTGKTTNRTTTPGGSSGPSDSGTTNPSCTPESKEITCGTSFCGIKKNNCAQDVNCICQTGAYCYTGEGTKDVCINNSINCSDSDEIDYYNKGNVSINNIINGTIESLFKEDFCSINLTEYYCYYNGTDFEARNESYECGYGCLNGKCELPSCTSDDNCTSISLSEIASCNNIPDNNSFTWDYSPENKSICGADNKCTIPTQTIISSCNISCGAECEISSNCLATECDNLDRCIGNDYYDYSDVSNNCLSNCGCENRTCGSPTIFYNDARCIEVECFVDDDCDAGYYCNAGNCVEVGSECSDDSDCVYRGPGFVCNSGNECEWLPPIGIPRPEFGIEETYRMYDNVSNRNPALNYTQNAEGGFYTHYVDNTHPNANDTGNVYGTASKPRLTIQQDLPAGSVEEIHGGPYTGERTLYVSGTSSQPIFVRGITDDIPVLSLRVRVSGDYLILENLNFNGGYLQFHGNYDAEYVCIRASEINNGGSQGILVSSGEVGPTDNIVIYNNVIHHNIQVPAEGDYGYNGIEFSGFPSYIWVVDNNIHDNGEDGIQSYNGVPNHVYVGRNDIYSHREQGIDMKFGEDWIISQNKVHEQPAYEAVRVNDEGPLDNIWIIFNEIYNSNHGINTGGATFPAYIIGNVFHDLTGQGVFEDGYEDWGSGPIIGNTFYNVAIGIEANAGDEIVVNNIVSGASTYHLIIGDNPNFSYNLLWQGGDDVIISGSEECVSCIEADPLFVDAENGDLHLQEGSPAIDSGIESDVYQRFYELYGIDIKKDIENKIRPQDGDNNGSAEWDIGAYEYESIEPTCSDGIQNQDEAGIDCGGVCVSGSETLCSDGIDNDKDCLIDEQDKNCIAGTWVPPIGIPRPEFGIEESYRMYDNVSNRNPALNYTQNSEGGYYTHYVDNTHPNATDDNNPYGTASKPRMTIPDHSIKPWPVLAAGAVLEIHGGPYNGTPTPTTRIEPHGNGTAQYPVFLRGLNADEAPDVNMVIRFRGNHFIIENINFEGAAANLVLHSSDPAEYFSFRHLTIHNSNMTGIWINAAQNVVVYDCNFHDLGDWTSLTEHDVHGVYIWGGNFTTDRTTNIWVVDNEGYYLQGDGVNTLGTSPCLNLYIGRNHFHHIRENAVDIKNGENVIISQNMFHDIHRSSSSHGDAIVANNEGNIDNFWVLFNDIYDCNWALAAQAGWGNPPPYMVGNVIHNMDNGTSGDDGSYGVRTENGGIFINNMMYDLDTGINDYTGTATISNNIIAEVGAHHYTVGSGNDMHNNLLWQTVGDIHVSGAAACIDCIEADPLFVNPSSNNFSLQEGSPAIDSGIESEVYQRFYDLYGINISKDIENKIRPQDGDENGSAEWDIGAYEYSSEVVGGTSASLSPFAKILNFLKALLTKETGNAILAGKTISGNVINGNAVDETRGSKVPYIILFLLAAIILVIAAVIVKKKTKKDKKKFKKKIGKRR